MLLYPAPWAWQAAKLHLSFESGGSISGYPEGTYNAQMRSKYGRLQFAMMFVIWETWNAWSGGEGTPEGKGKDRTPYMDEDTVKLRDRLDDWLVALLKKAKQHG